MSLPVLLILSVWTEARQTRHRQFIQEPRLNPAVLTGTSSAYSNVIPLTVPQYVTEIFNEEG